MNTVGRGEDLLPHLVKVIDFVNHQSIAILRGFKSQA
jgi:hypothetical protein